MSLHETLVSHGAEVTDPSQHFTPSEISILHRLGARVYRISEDASDTAAFSTRYAVEPARCLNSILVQTKTSDGPVESLVLVPAHIRLKSSTLKKALGGKTSFLPADQAFELTGMAPGAITPIGIPAEVPVILDATGLDRPSYILGGKSRELKVEVPASALTALAAVDFPGLYD
ncbi:MULTISPECIES: YbaK/EbsC family protein [Kocuria]|uniref:YbaK/EbsC family protein n=1 Tax=Kocuria TaxID=57493 RepID=UPI00139256C0|nr:YbaK/EbsC family protein [Kocuria palustris]MXN63257.1 hypothetical protein [Bacillus sp. BGMRC0062]